MRRRLLLVPVLLLCAAMSALAAEPLEITLAPDGANPASPQMGEHLQFGSVIRNTGGVSLHGIVAWISMVRMDPGQEQPMDLEDWSAHKAVTRATLAPDGAITVNWPMRLIQAGDFRVVISAVTRDSQRIVTSPFLDFHVRPKPVVESSRILPVAFGMPLLIGGLLAFRMRGRILRR
ncbi:MAG TPA: hypothetical protein VKB51_18820 [bacterium]|nr:hypothetical protein [bacterium]